MQAARSFESRVLSQLLQTRTSIPKARRYPLPHRSISTNFRPLHARQATRSRPHLPQSQSHPLRAARSLRLSSTKANAEAASSATLSARLKKLSREYGWSALGVYLLLSALDFPFCFLGVRLLGTERIGRWEHNVVEGVKSLISWPLKAEQTLEAGGPGPAYGGEREQRLLDEQVVEERWDHGVEEAEKANSGEGASLSSPRPPKWYRDFNTIQVFGLSSPWPTRSTNPSSSSGSR